MDTNVTHLNSKKTSDTGHHLQKLEKYKSIIQKYAPEIEHFVSIYEDIHQHPELSCFEERTALVVVKCLEEIGLEVKSAIGGHGVVGMIRNGLGETILLRAELDALPIEEETGLPYASKIRMKDYVGREQPVMHACGHDIHIACLLACVRLLFSARKHWNGTILAVFQPNEEIPGGAQAMIDDGLYDSFPIPDIMLAQHVGMSKAGMVAVRTGPVLPASDYIEIDISSEGKGPNPVECPEPVSLATYLLTRFQRIIGTDIDRGQFATLVCRDFHARFCGDLFTNQVTLRLETKTTNGATRDQIVNAVKSITTAECSVFDGKIKADVTVSSRAPVTRNNTQMAETLQTYFSQYFGDKFWIPPMDTPVEDFAILSGPEPVPFVYWKLGSTEPGKWDEAERKGGDIIEHLPTNHSPKFAPDPHLTITTGMNAMTLAALIFADEL